MQAPDLGIIYEARGFDSEDSRLASAFRSGEITYDSYIGDRKYKDEGIMGAIILPNSICQIGYGWTRHVPFIVQTLPAPKSLDNLVALTISGLLNQAKKVACSLKTNEIISVLKPQVLSSLVAEVNSSSINPDERKTGTNHNSSLRNTSTPGHLEEVGHFKPRPFDFNSRVATYLDSLDNYSEVSLPLIKRRKLPEILKPTNPNSRRYSVESRRYKLGYKEPLPSATESFWDEFVIGLSSAEKDIFVSTVLEIFIAYRSLAAPLHHSIDFTISAYEQTRNMLDFLQEVELEEFESLPVLERSLCNFALWILGTRKQKLTETQHAKFLSDFGIDSEQQNRFHQSFKIGSLVATLWNSDVPIERMGNIKLDLYSALNSLPSQSHSKLSTALGILSKDW